MLLARMIAARVGASLFVLLAISLVMFVGVETLPGDFASATAPRFVTEAQVAPTREALGLNDPAPQRYVAWLGRAMRGEFGQSWYSGRDIAPLLGERLWFTAQLAGLAALMAVPAGAVAGMLAAALPGGLFDRATSTASLAMIALPEFLVAHLLMALFVVSLPVFPAHTVFFDGMGLGARLHAMVLPAASLAVVAFAPVLRLTRASLLGVLATDYILTARLKGLPTWRVILVHALPNAVPPIVNMLVMVAANFLVGAFIVEQIFAYPGIGSALVAAVKFRDLPLVLAIGLVFAVIFVALNLAADILSLLATPRARLPAR